MRPGLAVVCSLGLHLLLVAGVPGTPCRGEAHAAPPPCTLDEAPTFGDASEGRDGSEVEVAVVDQRGGLAGVADAEPLPSRPEGRARAEPDGGREHGAMAEPASATPRPGTLHPEPVSPAPLPGTLDPEPVSPAPLPGTLDPRPASPALLPVSPTPDPMSETALPGTLDPRPASPAPLPVSPTPEPGARASRSAPPDPRRASVTRAGASDGGEPSGRAAHDASATLGVQARSQGGRGTGASGDGAFDDGAAHADADPDALGRYLRAVQRAIAQQAQQHYARGRRGGDDDEPLVLRLRIALDPDGRITGVALAQSSGSPRLDRIAASATERVQLPPPPPGVARTSRVLTLPIRFQSR